MDNEKITWIDICDKRFDLYGFDDGKGGITARIPEDIRKPFSEALADSALFSAGCRARFSANSDKIALRVTYGKNAGGGASGTLNLCKGFVLFKEVENKDIPVHIFCPAPEKTESEFEGIKHFDKSEKMYNYTLVFPLTTQILSCEIGFSEGAAISNGKKYQNDKPVIFYGSSITHGLAASHSGNIYEQMISRKYNLDYVDLGFAGNAKGEPEMAQYIASREMCAFVCDYDHNAPDAEHLKKTYPVMYETVRKNHPDIPYVVISKPDYLQDRKEEQDSNEKRRLFIKSFYESKKENGDNNIYFIDGSTFFPPQYNLCCTADLCHPNDLGFSFMAEKIGNLLSEVLNLKEI